MSPVARYIKFIVGEYLLSKFQCNVTAVWFLLILVVRGLNFVVSVNLEIFNVTSMDTPTFVRAFSGKNGRLLRM